MILRGRTIILHCNRKIKIKIFVHTTVSELNFLFSFKFNKQQWTQWFNQKICYCLQETLVKWITAGKSEAFAFNQLGKQVFYKTWSVRYMEVWAKILSPKLGIKIGT